MLRKLLGAFSVVALTLVVASSASAITVSELKALGLTDAQAQAIAAVLSASASQNTSVSTTAYTRDLTIGSTGSDVVALQDMLIANGNLVMPAGVSKGYFGALTKSSLMKYQTANGISPASGYFGPITRASIKVVSPGTPTTPGSSNSGDLKGGAGDIKSVDKTTSGTETTLGEGKTEDVLGFDIDSDNNSDLEITSIRVSIGAGSAGSTRLNRYLDEASIMMDGDEVGMVDVSDFSRDGATSTATISLKNAVIKADDTARFYVTLTATDSINDSDLDNTLSVVVDRIRFEDATGAILTENASGINESVDFDDSSADDDARVKSDSATRDAGLLKVEANTKSDDFDILSFKLDVDDQSSDLVVTEMKVVLSIKNASTTGALDVNKFLQELYLEVDGQNYDDYSYNDTSVAANATENITATFTIDEGDLEIAQGDIVDGVVWVVFGKQAGNYATSSTVKANVLGSDIIAENPEGDVFTVKGTANGEIQTAQISAATVDNFTWAVNNTGTLIDFFFTVEATDEDFAVLASSIASTTSGTATTSVGVLSLSTGDADTVSAGVSYEVLDGDTATFRVRYSLTGTNGTFREVKITSVAGQELPTNKQISPTATINVN